MRFLLFVLFTFTAVSLPNSTNAQPKPVKSAITHATVYMTGAQITRTADVELSSGVNEVYLTNLSSSLRERSVTLSSDKAITLRSVQKQEAEQTNLVKIDSLQEKLTQLKTRISHKQSEQQVLSYEVDILMDNNKMFNNDYPSSIEELDKAMDYFHNKLSEIKTKQVDLKINIDKLLAKADDLKSEIEEVKEQKNKNSATLYAAIGSEKAQTVRLTFRYYTSKAGWKPSYDLRAENIEEPVQLTYKANINQSTGVDWHDISLSISSANPRNNSSIPVFKPSYLHFRSTQPQRAGVPKTYSKFKSSQSFDEMKQSIGGIKNVERNLTSFAFNIERSHTIKSDKNPKAVSLKEMSFPTSYQYYAMPKADKTAYLTAEISDWKDRKLLTGPMNLYFSHSYVGQSKLNSNSVDDTLTVSLGEDKSISIDRKQMKKFSEKNFFGGKVKRTEAWNMTVRNNKERNIKLKLVDQVPISTNEDIEVSVEDRSGAHLNKNTGKLYWLLNLNAGQSKSRQLRYQLKYPSDKKITEKHSR